MPDDLWPPIDAFLNALRCDDVVKMRRAMARGVRATGIEIAFDASYRLIRHRGRTALAVAAELDAERCLADLLPQADVDAADAFGGRTALMSAAAAGAQKTLALLLPLADWEKREPASGRTALTLAIERGQNACAQMFFAAKAQGPGRDPRASDGTGRNAWTEAAAQGDPEMAAWLAHFFTPDSRDAGGQTALMGAALNGRELAAKALLGKGAVRRDAKELAAVFSAACQRALEFSAETPMRAETARCAQLVGAVLADERPDLLPPVPPQLGEWMPQLAAQGVAAELRAALRPPAEGWEEHAEEQGDGAASGRAARRL